MSTTTNEQMVDDVASGVVLDRIDDRLIMLQRSLDTVTTQITEIHEFCQRLAQTLDALSGNPMVSAMLPPGTFGG